MRVTHNMLHSRILDDINSNFRNIAKLHMQGSSGKKVIYPSDDAIVATRASNIASRIREMDQYQRNANTVETYLKAYDTVTGEMSSLVYRLRELTVQGANGTLTEHDRKTIANEIDSIREHMVQLANTNVSGEYIYGGSQSDVPPVDQNGQILPGLQPGEGSRTVFMFGMAANADQKISVDLGGYRFEYNTTVYEAFTVDGNETIFNLVNNISQNLKADNPDFYLNEQALEKLDRFEYRIQQLISRNGSSQRFLDMATTRFEDFSLFLTEYLSKEQDADMMEVYTSLANQQSILEAALKTGSSVMMTSLVDFVK
ncbi:MAG TPA: flagellar hook-associated protein FlgL [Thermotogota bacterium]|nr:flagellar hook-associated protein FlgL [Thermotogota bacterium]HRW93786.1 flagellar hook-associated protein FlgL [Thermotogota bacterium]